MRNIFWEKGEFKWWILFLCAYHFFPFIATKGSIVFYAWAYGIPLVYMTINIKYVKKAISAIVYSEALIPITGMVILSCLSMLLPVINNTWDFTYFTGAIMTMVKILFRMLFLFIVIVKNVPSATKETFMKYFIFSCCLYICSTIVMIALPQLKEIFLNLVKESESAKKMALETRYQTRYGWAGFSGFEYTFKCVLAIIFICYLIEKNMKDKNNLWWIFVIMFLFCGTLFYGRVGSLVSMLILFTLAIKLLMRRPKIVVIAFAVFGIAAIGLFILQSRNESVRAWFVWAFDLFVTFLETGKFQTDSSNVLLQKMLFIPDIHTLLFGDAMYTTKQGYYMFTDAGIMRTVLFGGIGFVMIRYLSVYVVFVLKILGNKILKEEKTMYFWILAICFIFEIKGEILFSCFPIVIWLIVMEAYMKGKNNNGERFKFEEIIQDVCAE